MKTLSFMPSQFTVRVVACLLTTMLASLIAEGRNDDDPFGVDGFDCTRVEELGIEKQLNLRAAAILRYCGIEKEVSHPQPTLVEAAYAFDTLSLFGGTDINLITADALPRVTQADSAVWGHRNTVVVAITDSRGMAFTPRSFCGASVSTDSGATFTRLAYQFNTTGTCDGNPSVTYSVRAAKWYIAFAAGRCANGYGRWQSNDGVTWTEAGCYQNTGMPDAFSIWIDNNPSSPFYGRQYIVFNNFAVNGGAIQAKTSTDDGVTFGLASLSTATFRRAIGIVGSPGTDGNVFVQAMDEGGGGLNGLRTNFIYRSPNDGGSTWTAAIQQRDPFLGPGRSVSGYFAGMYAAPVAGYWRHMGAGQIGYVPATPVYPSGNLHYVFASRTGAVDPGDVYYIRSFDLGATWTAPLRLNTDVTTRGQWHPSLAVSARGKLIATWYDERNTVDDSLQRYSRVSLDNGLSWGPDMPISDVVFPKPLQLDPLVPSTYVGDRHFAAFSGDGRGNIAYDAWTDGRVTIGSPQQDIFFDKVNFSPSAADFDGDGKTDISIFRPTPREWWINRSSNGSTFAVQFGNAADRIVPGDYTGDGRTDVAVWRPATGQWFVLRSENSTFFALPFGANGDIPAPADFDDDGKADFVVFRPASSTWYISQSSGAPTRIEQFGSVGDQPVASDYDGDGKADVGIYRPNPGQWWIQRSTAGLLVLQFGNVSDKAVPGDYTGDGKSDIAIWRPPTGEWFIVRSEDLSFYGFPFGTNGDTVAPGDYDGDGRFDATVFRPANATWYIARSTAGTQIVQFGVLGDRPIANAFVP